MSIGEITVCKISCADLERSAAFYQRLGFVPLGAPSVTEAGEVLRLYGVAARRLRSQLLARGDNARSVRIELLEWDPGSAAADSATPAGATPGAPGVGMLGLRCDDLMADYAALSAEGFDFVSEPVVLHNPRGLVVAVHLRDPDGFNLQLLQVSKTPAADA